MCHIIDDYTLIWTIHLCWKGSEIFSSLWNRIRLNLTNPSVIAVIAQSETATDPSTPVTSPHPQIPCRNYLLCQKLFRYDISVLIVTQHHMTAINNLCSSPITVNLFNTKNVPMSSQQHYFFMHIHRFIQPQEETNHTVLFMYHDNFPSYIPVHSLSLSWMVMLKF